MENNKMVWVFNLLIKTELKQTLAEIMLGLFWGVLFLSSIIDGVSTFDNAEGKKRSLRKLSLNQGIARVKAEEVTNSLNFYQE